MKIFHVISNFKWTERAEPASDLACGQRESGADISLICGRDLEEVGEDSIAFRAREKGLAVTVMEMPKHFGFGALCRDFRSIRALAGAGKPAVLHTHMPNAQLTAVLACGRRAEGPLIVHSVYEPDGKAMPLRNRMFSFAGTHGWIVISDQARLTLMNRYGIPPERILVLEPPVDVSHFQSESRSVDDVRNSYGFGAGDFVVGLVSRIGLERGVDFLLKAVAAIKSDCPGLKVLIVGRGAVEDAVIRPSAELRISDRIVLAGYCRGDKLVEAYRAMDIFCYIQPGTDKSCRTIREALSAGVPVAGKRMGFIPQLVSDGETGYLFDDDPADLARILKEQYSNRAGLVCMGRAASRDAALRFDRKSCGRRTLDFYAGLSCFPG